MKRFLDESDFSTPTWRRIEEFYTERLAMLRRKNDQHSLDAVQTAAVRGQIEEVTCLLAQARKKNVSAAAGTVPLDETDGR